MYIFNVFDEPRDNNHIIIILTYLDTKPHFFLKNTGFDKSKNPLHIFKLSLLYLHKCIINQNKNYIFIIRKDQGFCDQSCAICRFFLKKIENFHLPFLFFQNIFNCNIPLRHKLQRYQIYYNLLNGVKIVIMARKINEINKKLYWYL